MNHIDAIWNELKPVLEKHFSTLEPKKEEPKKAQEFWISPYDIKRMIGPYIFEWPVDECIHVREILPGEIVVTREQLAKVWDKYIHLKGDFFTADFSADFIEFCKELGFKD